MKKIFLIAIFSILILNSCSTENDQPNIHYEILPVVSYELPKSFIYGETYKISMFYKRPTTCHFFEGIYFETNNNVRTIGIQSGVREINGCQTIDPLIADSIKTTMNFKVIHTQPYIFKFYKGNDKQGHNLFFEVKIPVIN